MSAVGCFFVFFLLSVRLRKSCLMAAYVSQMQAALITAYLTYIVSRDRCGCTFGGTEAAVDGNK